MQLFTNIQGFVGPCGGIGHLQLVIENWADDYSNLDGISEDLLPLMRKSVMPMQMILQLQHMRR